MLEVVINESIKLPDAKTIIKKYSEKSKGKKPSKIFVSVEKVKVTHQEKTSNEKSQDKMPSKISVSVEKVKETKQEKTSNEKSKSVHEKSAKKEAHQEDAKQAKLNKTET